MFVIFKKKHACVILDTSASMPARAIEAARKKIQWLSYWYKAITVVECSYKVEYVFGVTSKNRKTFKLDLYNSGGGTCLQEGINHVGQRYEKTCKVFIITDGCDDNVNVLCLDQPVVWYLIGKDFKDLTARQMKRKMKRIKNVRIKFLKVPQYS